MTSIHRGKSWPPIKPGFLSPANQGKRDEINDLMDSAASWLSVAILYICVAAFMHLWVFFQ